MLTSNAFGLSCVHLRSDLVERCSQYKCAGIAEMQKRQAKGIYIVRACVQTSDTGQENPWPGSEKWRGLYWVVRKM